ncbi:MAG: hypothetical protein ACYC7E_05300 [Armatimonadota bacterium]
MRWLSLCLLALFASATIAGTVTFTYTEALKRSWQHEVMHFTVKAPKDAISATMSADERAKALAGMFVTDETGTAVPSQVDVPVYSPEYEQTPVVVTLIADFQPWQQRTWTLHYGEKMPAIPPTGLKATATKDGLVLENGRIAVRTGSGVKLFKTAATASAVPAPILAVRGPSGAWLGRGWLESPQRVTKYSITLTHDGPVFKRVCADYDFEGGRYTCYITLRAGEDAVHVREEFNLGDPSPARDSNFCFSLTPGLQPDTIRWYGRYTNIDPYKQFNPTNAVVAYGNMQEAVFPINYGKTQELMRIHGLFVWWPQSASYFGAYQTGKPQGDILAIFPERPGHWRNPTVLFLNTTKEKELVLRAPIRQPVQDWVTDGVEYRSPYYTGTVYPGTLRGEGVREWGLQVARAGDVIPEKDDFMKSGIRKAWTRYGQNPLDKIKDWTLAWDDPGPGAYPRGAIGVDDLPALRERAQRIAKLKALIGSPQYQRYTYLVTQDAKIGDKLLRWDANGDTNWMGILPKLRWSIGCYLDTQGDLGINTFMHHGNGHIMLAAPLFDVAMSIPDMTPDERREAKALYAFCMYKLSDPDWLAYGAGFHLGNPNMPTMSMSLIGAGASLIPEHPKAYDWMMTSAKSTLDMLRNYTAPGGAWRECPHYQMDAAMSGVMQSAAQFKNAGFIDLYQNPFLKATMLYHAQLLTPVDPRFGIRTMPAIGNGTYEPTSLYGRMAAGAAKSDPQYSKWLQWAWKACGTPYMYGNDELVCDEDLPAEAPDMNSRHFPGFGSVMRSHFGDPNETYLVFRMGYNIEHYEDDQGEIVLYSRGAPLLMDFGSQYAPMMLRSWLHNKVSINHMVSWLPVGTITENSFLDAADACLGSITYDRMYPWPEDPFAATPPNAVPPAVPLKAPTTWTRQVVLVKNEVADAPHYVVLRDGFTGRGDDFTEFSLWDLATGVQTQGNVARYAGQHGVDVAVTVLDPPNPAFATGKYSHNFIGPTSSYWAKMNPGKKFEEVQHYIRLKRNDHGGYFAVIYPHRPNEVAPTFTPWARGAGVTAVVGGERQVVICAPQPGDYVDGDIRFSGQRALVRQSAGRLVLALLAGTHLEALGHELRAPGPVAVTIAGKTLTGEANLAAPGMVTLRLPAKSAAATATLLIGEEKKTVEIVKENDALKIALPKGKCRFEITL